MVLMVDQQGRERDQRPGGVEVTVLQQGATRRDWLEEGLRRATALVL